MGKGDLDSDPKALRETVAGTLYNRRLDPALWAAIDAGTALQRGSLSEILDLSKSLGLSQFIQANGLAQIENNEQVQAKLAELVSVATSMSPAEAFAFVKHWLQQADKAGDVQTLAHSYMAIATTMDRRNLRAITADTLTDKDFTHALGMTVSYDHEIKLPRGDAHTIDNDLLALREAAGRKAEVVKAVDYKGAYLVKLLADLLAEATKKQIGADVLSGSAVVFKEDVHSYDDALLYVRPLPDGVKQWEKRGLRDSRFMTDYDHLAFLDQSERMSTIVTIVLPEGDKHPLYQTYKHALSLRKQGGLGRSIEQDEQAVHLALRNLQQALYQCILTTFRDCYKPIHPEVELAARNIAWYSLTTGEGAKFSSYWAQIQPLDQSGHINQSAKLPLSTSVQVLAEIAATEGIALTNEKKNIADRLIADLTVPDFSQYGMADKIMSAYKVMKMGGNPISTATTEVENWYITNVLFRVLPDHQGTKASKDGQPRTYRSILELVQFIRTFATN